MSENTIIKIDLVDLLLKAQRPVECIMCFLREKENYEIDIDLFVSVWKWMFSDAQQFNEDVMSNKLNAEVIKIIYRDLQEVMENKLV